MPDKRQISGLDETGTIDVPEPAMSEPPVPLAAEEREAPPAIPAASPKLASALGYRLSYWLVPVSGPGEKGGTADG